MDTAGFTEFYEETLMAVEEAIDALDSDIDYETVNQILTIYCPDGSQVIITPQSATGQLWVAARSGGFHFNASNGHWSRTTDDRSLPDVLDDVFVDQAGIVLGLSR